MEPVNNDPYKFDEEKEIEKDPILTRAYAIISVALILGFIFLIVYFKNKNGITFGANEGLGDLGSFLSGTVGILITLAGIYFIRKTIEQTRTELTQTRDIMLTQMAETTYFNLINNHKGVVTGDLERKNKFEREIRDIKSKIHKYKKALSSKTFETFSDTNNHPAISVRRSAICYEVIKSIIHIIEFTTARKLTKKRFYYETLEINLTKEESYLIGLVLYYNLYPVKIRDMYKQIFLRNLYSEQDYLYSNLEGYFPPITLEHIIESHFDLPINWRDGMEVEFFEKHCKCSIKGAHEVNFEKLEYTGEYWPGTSSFINPSTTKYLKGEIELNGRRYFSLADFVCNTILPIMKETNFLGFNFTFHCKYKDQSYQISFGNEFRYEQIDAITSFGNTQRSITEYTLRYNGRGK